MDAKQLREERELLVKLDAACGGERAISASYTPEINRTLLGLARDGLRFRLMRFCATDGEGAIPDEFVPEIDRQLAAL